MAVTPKIVLAVAVGFVLVPIAAACGAYGEPVHPSIKPGKVPVDYWTWQWMNWWYANTEDGNGLVATLNDGSHYRDSFAKWVPDWIVVAFWSGFRNSANNAKRPYRTDTWLPAGTPNGGAWPL
jgi:hypothetical protein